MSFLISQMCTLLKLSDEVSIHMPENQVIDLEELDEEELLIRAVARMIFKSDRSFPPFE